MAYDIPKGNPLRNWNALDFVISNNGGLKPAGKGVNAKLVQGNIVELLVIGEVFQFAVDGFDRHRDLYVRVDDISAEAAAGEAAE
jgi:hypothetical protein